MTTKTISAPQWAKRLPLIILALVALFYISTAFFSPQAIVGTDDSARGWFEKGYKGIGTIDALDRFTSLNGGTGLMERRFGRFLNPTFPLYQILPLYQARTLDYLFWIAIAGLFMYWYCRTMKLSRGSAFIAGVGYMLAPGLLAHIFPGHFAKMEVIALMPGIIAFTERMLQKFKLLDIIGLSILLCLAIYSLHLQLAYFVFVGMGFYFAARMIYSFAKKEVTVPVAAGRSAAFALALTFGALLTSMNTFPSMHQVNTESKRAGGVDYEYAASFALHIEEVISLLEPDFVGWKEYYWGRNPLKLNSEYFGIILVLLACALFVIRKPHISEIILLIIAFGALLFALGPNTPFHRICYSILPGIKSFRAPSMMYIWVFFPIVALAAKGVQELLVHDWQKETKLRKKLMLFAGISSGLALLFVFAGPSIAQALAASADVSGEGNRRAQTLQAYLPMLTRGALLTFLTVAAFAGALALYATKIINRQVLLGALAVLIVIDAVRISRPFFDGALKPVNSFKQQEAFEKSVGDFITGNDKDIFRVHSLMGDQKQYFPGLTMAYIFDDFIDKRYNDLFQNLNQSLYGLMQPQYKDNPFLQARTANYLNLFNIKYLVALNEIAFPGAEMIVNQGGLRIYRNNGVFPRAWIADSFVVADDDQKTMTDMLEQPGFTKNIAVVASKEWLKSPIDASSDSIANALVTITKLDEKTGHISLNVQTTKPALVVVAENYSIGWKATINGKPTAIIHADYAWMGIPVVAGAHSIEMIYDSAIANKWRRVTIIAAIIFGLFSVGAVVYTLRNRKLPA